LRRNAVHAAARKGLLGFSNATRIDLMDTALPPADPQPPDGTGHAADARRSLDLLARAGDLLASSLDYRQTLQHVARLCVPALGDLCMVDIVEGGHLLRMATAHVDSAKAALVDELTQRRPTVEGSPAPAGRVLASGEPELLEDVTPEVVAAHTADSEHARLILAIGIRSHVAVPMVARGTIVGVLSIGITESTRRFSAHDVGLASELGRRAAMAVDNARLYAAAQSELDKRRQAESALQRALSIGRINVWDWELASDRVTCSDNARDVWGIEVGQAADFLAVVDPDDVPMTQALAQQAMESREPYEMTYRLRVPGMPLRWVTSRGRVEYDEAGKPVRILGMTMDITARKRAEDATRLLADAGQRLGSSLDYQATLSSLAPLVVPTLADWYAVDLLAPDGTLQRVSVHHPDPAMVTLANKLQEHYPPRRDQPGNPWDLMASGQVEWVEEIPDELLVSSADDARHLALLRSLQLKSYVRVPLVARGSAIGLLTLVFAESGRRYGTDDVALATELAGRAAAAVDNARLFAQLQLGDQRKDEFLAMLAHELRNPLAPISTAAQLLRMVPESGPRVVQASQVISRQVAHMTELVDDLLDVSRVTRGLIRLEREVVEMTAVAAAAVEQVQSLVQAKSHALAVHAGAGPLTVDGDRARLVQVVANLLNNAAKYTPAGGSIALRMERIGAQLRIEVSDDGAGIEPALLPEVFELFTQGQRTPDRMQGGLGIGLALVRRLVQLHGGQVSAQSPGPGQGSTFTVLLPFAEAAQSPPAPAGELPSPARRRRILVADDNVDAADVLATVLRLEGHDVHVAHDGAQALQLARRVARLDLCLLDIGLPDMTGHALARTLRDTLGDDCPMLVALTGYGQPEDHEQSAAAGFDRHLVKPAEVAQVLALVAALP